MIVRRMGTFYMKSTNYIFVVDNPFNNTDLDKQPLSRASFLVDVNTEEALETRLLTKFVPWEY